MTANGSPEPALKKSTTPAGKQMTRLFVTGASDEAVRIAKALGLGDLAVSKIQLTIDAGDIIKAHATFYPTAEQIERLAAELEGFEANKVATAEVRFIRQSDGSGIAECAE